MHPRWGEKTLEDSETQVLKMGTTKFNELQSEGRRIFQEIAANIPKGPGSPEVQELVLRLAPFDRMWPILAGRILDRI